tara:strand:+ start:116 stop:490 length:375 start_codon:yes stop_codon:yes gene_type:complete
MKNVLGTDLKSCSQNPKTGFFRDGFCRTNEKDQGKHVVASIMTDEFLIFSKSKGNDLSTPNPVYGFPGLKKGNKWCLCAIRWQEAYKEGYAPKVILEATHEKALDYIELESLIEMSRETKKIGS